MAAENNLTDSAKFVKAQSVDMVNTFTGNLRKLIEVMGVTDIMPVPSGMKVKTYVKQTTLAAGTVAEGDIIPLSKAQYTAGPDVDIVLEKYRKAVSAEAIQKSGFNRAVVSTDDMLVKEIQKGVKKAFFAQLTGGSPTAIDAPKNKGLQGALAAAWGKVQVLFEDDGVNTIAFANPEDVADYLGGANIVVADVFGLTVVSGFLNTTVILNSAVTKGTIFATAPQNIKFAYVPVSGSELSKAFPLVSDQTGYIGVLHDTQHDRVTYETVALHGGKFFAERADGVVKVTIK